MKKVLIIAADMFEDTELLVPYYRLKEEGVDVTVASLRRGTIKGKHGYDVKVDTSVKDMDPEDYDALVIPGGKAPATLRKDENVIAATRHFFDKMKPVAAICHGPQILISAGLLKGRNATCYRRVREELKGAGGLYVDSEVVVDGNLVTSRQPGDLPAFMREFLKKLNKKL
jgi:protease I